MDGELIVWGPGSWPSSGSRPGCTATAPVLAGLELLGLLFDVLVDLPALGLDRADVRVDGFRPPTNCSSRKSSSLSLAGIKQAGRSQDYHY
ncbi:hypothetical protein ACFQ7G_07045 [Streptomyces massasporeus]